jgi:hypothetical protein
LALALPPLAPTTFGLTYDCLAPVFSSAEAPFSSLYILARSTTGVFTSLKFQAENLSPEAKLTTPC